MCVGPVTVLGRQDPSPQRATEDRSAVPSPAGGSKSRTTAGRAASLGAPQKDPSSCGRPRSPGWGLRLHAHLSPGLLLQGRLSRVLVPPDGGTSAGGPSLSDGRRPCEQGHRRGPGGAGTASGPRPPHHSVLLLPIPSASARPHVPPGRSCILWVWGRQASCKHWRCAPGQPRTSDDRAGDPSGPPTPGWPKSSVGVHRRDAPPHRSARSSQGSLQTAWAAGRHLPGPSRTARGRRLDPHCGDCPQTLEQGRPSAQR